MKRPEKIITELGMGGGMWGMESERMNVVYVRNWVTHNTGN